MAGFAVKAARDNYQRHTMVEQFMLVNDKATVACEIPVWYWEKNIDNGIRVNLDGKLKKGNLFSEADLDSMISDCKEITDRLEKEKNRIRNKNETP